MARMSHSDREASITATILMIIALLIIAGFYFSGSPSCQVVAVVHTPAQTIDKEYFVKDADGFTHLVTVSVNRPAHVDQVCQ